MFYTIQNMVLESWSLWCSMFKPLPYGDPFVATAALFVLVVILSKLASGGDPA